MYTNDTNIPLSLAVWLLKDNYDYNPDPNTLSATTIIRPVRELALLPKVTTQSKTDLNDLIASRFGTAVHDSAESAWSDTKNLEARLKAFGIPEKLAKRFVVNPKSLGPDDIPIYMERRSKKTIGKWTISGKFDICINGQLEDYKTTQTYTYVKKSNVHDYILQGSIYRWLNPDIITEDTIAISYLFTDWKAHEAKADRNYPQSKIVQAQYLLMSSGEIEAWLKTRIQRIENLRNSPESMLPQCTIEELWQDPTVWKYYANPAKTARSTKNFSNPTAAAMHMSTKGKGKGIIKEVRGKVKRCHYCNAYQVCTQRESMELAGLL